MLGKKGFTLIELLIVIIIVGILAAVSIPIMTGNLKQARASEAIAAVGSVRTGMRMVYAETGNYLKKPDGTTMTTGLVVGRVPGFSAGDLNGTFFVDSDYTVNAVTATTFTIRAAGSRTEVNGVDVTITDAGVLTTRY